MSLVKELFKILNKYNLKISAVESITGGYFSSLITSNKGASNFFQGSFISYSNEFKFNILKTSKNIPIVSKEMSKELSINSRKLLNSDISISFTGNASKNGIESKEKGLTYICVSNKTNFEVIKYQSLEKERKKIIEDTSLFGIQFICNFIKKNYK